MTILHVWTPACRSIGCTVWLHYIIPDAIVGLRNGEVHYSLHAAGNPRVSMNEACFRWIREEAHYVPADPRGRGEGYHSECTLAAQNFSACAGGSDGRTEALFGGGPSALKPLNLAVIAEKIGMHESTVSRAVNGKYIETPHGVYELRAF